MSINNTPVDTAYQAARENMMDEMTKREMMNELNGEYDSGLIGQCEYEMKKAELYEVNQEDSEMTNEATQVHKGSMVALTEQDFCELADELIAAYPEGMEANWLTQSLDQQLEMLASRVIGALDRQLAYYNKAIPTAVDKAKKAYANRDGSEASDQQLQRTTRWCKQLTVQKAFIETHQDTEENLVKAKEAYKAYFSKAWMPYSATAKKVVDENKKQTAASADAAEFLKGLEQ
jgi:uncharacterized protein YciW